MTQSNILELKVAWHELRGTFHTSEWDLCKIPDNRTAVAYIVKIAPKIFLWSGEHLLALTTSYPLGGGYPCRQAEPVEPQISQTKLQQLGFSRGFSVNRQWLKMPFQSFGTLARCMFSHQQS